MYAMLYKNICMCAYARDDFMTWAYASASAMRAVKQASPCHRPRSKTLLFANSRWHMQNICKGNEIMKWRVKWEKIHKNVVVIVIPWTSSLWRNNVGSNIVILQWNANEIKKWTPPSLVSWEGLKPPGLKQQKSILYRILMVSSSFFFYIQVSCNLVCTRCI